LAQAQCAKRHLQFRCSPLIHGSWRRPVAGRGCC
jgi:hypothetical protein